jgi:hypothetical protein
MISCFKAETGKSRDAALIGSAMSYFPESGSFHCPAQ